VDAHHNQIGILFPGQSQNALGWEFEPDHALRLAPIRGFARHQRFKASMRARRHGILMLQRHERNCVEQDELSLTFLGKRECIGQRMERTGGKVGREDDVLKAANFFARERFWSRSLAPGRSSVGRSVRHLIQERVSSSRACHGTPK